MCGVPRRARSAPTHMSLCVASPTSMAHSGVPANGVVFSHEGGWRCEWCQRTRNNGWEFDELMCDGLGHGHDLLHGPLSLSAEQEYLIIMVRVGFKCLRFCRLDLMEVAIIRLFMCFAKQLDAMEQLLTYQRVMFIA